MGEFFCKHSFKQKIAEILKLCSYQIIQMTYEWRIVEIIQLENTDFLNPAPKRSLAQLTDIANQLCIKWGFWQIC